MEQPDSLSKYVRPVRFGWSLPLTWEPVLGSELGGLYKLLVGHGAWDYMDQGVGETNLVVFVEEEAELSAVEGDSLPCKLLQRVH